MSTNNESCELTQRGLLATTILDDKGGAIELTLTESTASVSSDETSTNLDTNGSNFDVSKSKTKCRTSPNRHPSENRNEGFVRRPIFHCMQVVVDEAGAAAGWLCRSQLPTDKECFPTFSDESYEDLDICYDSSLSFDGSFDRGNRCLKHGVAAGFAQIADFSAIFGDSFSSATSGEETDTMCNPRERRNRKTSRPIESTALSIEPNSKVSQAIIVSDKSLNNIQQITRSRKRYSDFVHQTLLPRLSRMVKEYMQVCSKQNIPISAMRSAPRYDEMPHYFSTALVGHPTRLLLTSGSNPILVKPSSMTTVLKIGNFGTPCSRIQRTTTTAFREAMLAVLDFAQSQGSRNMIPFFALPSPYHTRLKLSYSPTPSGNTLGIAEKDDDVPSAVLACIEDPIVKAISSSVERYFHARQLEKENAIVAAAYDESKHWNNDDMKEIMCAATKEVFESLSDLPSFSDPSESSSSWDGSDDDGMDSEMNALGTISEKLRRELADTVFVPPFCVEATMSDSSSVKDGKAIAPITDISGPYEEMSDYCSFEVDEIRNAAMECWKNFHEWTTFRVGKT